MSPCVATTLPSLTATITPQPVPQNRQGAFDHFSSRSSPTGTFAAEAGQPMLAAAAAIAAALALRMVRRDRSMTFTPSR
jgi:hypothetical protein